MFQKFSISYLATVSEDTFFQFVKASLLLEVLFLYSFI